MSEPPNSSQATKAVVPREALMQCVSGGSLPSHVNAALERSPRNTQRLSRAARPCGRSANQERVSNESNAKCESALALFTGSPWSRNGFKWSAASCTLSTMRQPQITVVTGVHVYLVRASATQRPNPSVERTSNGGAHWLAPSRSVAPSAAAHLKR